MSDVSVHPAVSLHPRTQMVKCLLSLKCPHQGSSPIGDNELRWEEKFVSTLVKNMLNRSYEELMKALASRGASHTKCVFIKRLSADGRLQIGSKKVVPHVVAYRIWRNPTIKHASQLSARHPPTSYPPPPHAFSAGAATGATNNITPSGTGPDSFTGATGGGVSADSVCINPYHYSVCVNSVNSQDVLSSLKSSDAKSGAKEMDMESHDMHGINAISELAAITDREAAGADVICVSSGGTRKLSLCSLSSLTSSSTSSSSGAVPSSAGAGRSSPSSNPVLSSLLTDSSSPGGGAISRCSSSSPYSPSVSSCSADIFPAASDLNSNSKQVSSSSSLSNHQSSNQFELLSESIAGIRKRSLPSPSTSYYGGQVVVQQQGSLVHPRQQQPRQESPSPTGVVSHSVEVPSPSPPPPPRAANQERANSATANMLMTSSPMYGQQPTISSFMQTSHVPCTTSVNFATSVHQQQHQQQVTSSSMARQQQQQQQQDQLMAGGFGGQFSHADPSSMTANVNERVAYSSGTAASAYGSATGGATAGGGVAAGGRGVIQVMQLQQSSNNNNPGAGASLTDATSSFTNNCNVFYDLTSPITPPHTSQNLPGAAPPLTSYDSNSMVCVTSGPGGGIGTSTTPVPHSCSSPAGGGAGAAGGCKSNWISSAHSSTSDCEIMEYEDFTNENENQIAEIVAISSTPSSVSTTSCEVELQKGAQQPLTSSVPRSSNLNAQHSPQSYPPHKQQAPPAPHSTHRMMTATASATGTPQQTGPGDHLVVVRASPAGNYSPHQQQMQQQQLTRNQISFEQNLTSTSSSSSAGGGGGLSNSYNHRSSSTGGNMGNNQLQHDNQRNFDNNLFPSPLRDRITLGTPVRYADPLFWCQIRYYEYSQQVGEVFHVQHSIFHVDGGTDPSSAERFCLGSLSNVSRTKIVEETRSVIGKGLQLYRTSADEIYAECKSEHALFVQSQCCNLRYNWHPGTVCKIPPKCNLKLFTMAEFDKYLHQQMTADRSFKSILEMTSLCSIRISFIKGWGQEYNRKRVTDVPCWIEILLNGPSQWLDKVLQQINPSSEPCDSR